MSVRPTLYYALFSPQSRACLLTSKLINLDLELKAIQAAEHVHSVDYALKRNSGQDKPKFVDKGVTLYEGHVILTYIMSVHNRNAELEHLYPQDLLRRARIDERLYYNNGVLGQVIRGMKDKIIYEGAISYGNNTLQKARAAYNILEKYLKQSTYVVGEKISIADIAISTSLITIDKLFAVERKSFPRIHTWMQLMSLELPGYEEINEAGAQQLFQKIEIARENNMKRQ